MYGSFSSTFLAYRNVIMHNMSLRVKGVMDEMQTGHNNIKIEEDPFYCWQSISLMGKNRTVDFVVEDDSELFCFINYLQNYLHSIQPQQY